MEKAPENSLTLVTKLLDSLADCLTAEAAQQIVNLRADPEVQARLDYLAEQANQGLLSSDEEQEYGACVEALDFIALIQAKARALLRQGAAA